MIINIIKSLKMISGCDSWKARQNRGLATLNAPLNIAADAVADDVGCAEAGRIFSRLADPFGRGHRPPMSNALPLSGFDA
jgi:hypothetical protein